MAVKFEDVAAAALADALILLPQWMGGQRRGHEWVGERKANGGIGDSWSVNLNTGQWGAFASGQKGGDLVSLYAALNHLEQLAALKQVAPMVGCVDGIAPKTLPRTAPIKAPQKLPDRIPEGTPDPEDHPTLGAHAACYRYGNAFAIARYERQTESGPKKDFIQLTWRHGKWARLSHPAPRPPYNADLLPKHPTAPVMIVEGEKCADIASQQLRAYVCMTWAGGSNAVKQTDWACLAGRDVIIWPDADEPGRSAAAELAQILEPIASRVRIVQPNGQDPGWDIDDAVKEGMGPHEIAKWCAAHITDKISKPAESEPAPTPAAAEQRRAEPSHEDSGDAAAEPAIDSEYLPVEERKRDPDYPNEQPPRGAMVVWKDIGLFADSKDVPYPTLANASLIMRAHPSFKGKIWWDSFCERIYHTLRGGVAQEWNDTDSRRMAAFVQQEMQLPRIGLKIVEDAVMHAAQENPRNSVTEWLESLEWDGQEHLTHWVGDYLGVALTPYSMAVGRNWIISMVARAYRPSCQVDHMPVLEGTQGEGKSSALEILGDRWFAAVGTAFGSYEFINTIQGKWLVEIPDMAGFSRRDHSHVISTITTRTDRYRVKYGRFDQDHPRKCIFAATSETDDYLPEMRGYRRYWPLRCIGIDTEALRAAREQIFAEALVAYRAGATFHIMPAEATAAEQRARNSDDLWTDDVLAYCEQRAHGGYPVQPAKILTDSTIQLERKNLDHSAKLRVINILKAHGWIKKPGSNSREYIKVKREPNESEDS